VRKQTIVFAGNCQLAILADLYGRIVPNPNDNEIVYLPAHEAASEEQLRLVARADILVRQVLDFVPRIGDLETTAAVHLVPHVTAAFLWPCTGQPHPKNQPHRYSDPSGPYNAELGDSFLNHLILEGVDPDEAVLRFMEANIATIRRVDRMHEIMLGKQRSRDLACGYRFADFIEGRFRHEYLFRTPNHPEVALTIELATEVFGRLGVDSHVIATMRADPPDELFPATQTPIHPSIIAHFGLSYVDAQTRYRYRDEGRFTCAEYAGRYMRYEWNPLLGEGFELAGTGQQDAAIETLRRAVRASPRSSAGKSLLSHLLDKRGLVDEALMLAHEAVELEPGNPHYTGRLAQITAQHRAGATLKRSPVHVQTSG
jgi:tetratricopeptide (TPR) repeat protein